MNFFKIIFLLLPVTIFSQEIKKDSVKANKLEEVVVTGQYSKQSVKKSIFDVTVIKRAEIEQNAANNLADLLNQTLNISITPNTKSGKSGISLFGFDSQYVKILIDNIPVINEEGVGNNIDLTLINLDDIQQIEIVEGSMGVQYGSNAVAGIINIITKKGSKYKLKLSASIQEETVGNEYEWFDKGKHIQSIKLDYNINDNLFASIAFSNNNFSGFWNGRKGRIHDKDDGLRGHDWLPKENSDTKLLLNYKNNGFNVFYKFGYLHETIESYNQTVNLNHHTATDTNKPTALDRIYTNERFIHNLNFNGTFGSNKNYDVSLSYQTQTQELKSYTYHIRESIKENIENIEYKSRNVFTSRGTLGNLINTKKFKLQTGYDISSEKGIGTELSSIAGDVDSQKLNAYDVFTSGEYVFNDKLSLRPGVRASFSNVFDNQFAYSLSSKYLFNKDAELRLVVGTANRTPNYTELFMRFLHPSHDILGNINLSPENGFSVFTHLKKTTWINDSSKLSHKLSIGYIDLRDKIELLLVTNTPRDTYSFENIDNYKTLNFSLTNSFLYKDFKFNLGFSYNGIKQYFDESHQDQGAILFTPNLNANILYNLKKHHTSFALTYKYNGKRESFVFSEVDANGNNIFSKGTTDDFSWLDATIKKLFLDKKLETTFGVRNILDVTVVNSTAFAGGGHGEAPISFDMAYGRSYFLKLTYNLKQK